MNKVIVCGRDKFPDEVEKRGSGWAYISISATPDCAKYWLKDETESEHFLEDGENVLNLEFDDLSQDFEYQGHVFKTITDEQAKRIVDFIEGHLEMNILIHCKAGKSRSQGVWRFIIDMFPDYYSECEENKQNPCLTPNMEVVRKLKRAYYEKYEVFN